MNKENLLLKKHFSFSGLWMVIVLGVALLGILFGSFFDYQISSSIASIENPLGKFVETLGESLAYMTIPVGGTTIFLGLYRRKNLGAKILGYVLLALSLAISIYLLGDSFVDTNEYGYTFSTPVSYLLSTLLNLIASLCIFLFLDKKDTRGLTIVGAILLISLLGQFIFTNILKVLASRPRYRFLSDASKNVEDIAFRAWWQFKPFTAESDHFKSFPSGHTATAVQVMLLPLLTPFFKYKFKHSDLVFFLFGFGYTLFVAFSRILIGAHFLSDVSFGLLVASLAAFASILITEKITSKKTNEIKQGE